MAQPRKEIISWREVSKLIGILTDQLETEFDQLIMVSPGGVIPGGMLAAAAGIEELLLAQVAFPPDPDEEKSKLFSWPTFLQFPEHELIDEKNILVVNNAWGSGRSTRAVQKRVDSAGGIAYTSVLHFNPYRNLLKCEPDYYAAITDAFIIYPWEIDQIGPDRVLLENGGKG